MSARPPMVLRPMSRPSNRRITGVIEQPATVNGSQRWRNWVVEPGQEDPARAAYIDELLAKRRQRMEASRG